MSTNVDTDAVKQERERLMNETKANLVEMRGSLARSMDMLAEYPNKIDDDALSELHMAADLILAAIKQIENGMVEARKRGTKEDEKVA